MRSITRHTRLIIGITIFLCVAPAIALANPPTFVREWATDSTGSRGVAIGPNQHVYVTNELQNHVTVYTSDGVWLSSWGSTGTGEGQFQGCRGIGIDQVSGDVYVSDLASRIQRFTASGEYITGWDHALESPLAWPLGLVVDEEGNVWVADMYNRFIRVFRSNGEFRNEWHGPGVVDSQLVHPVGLTLVDHNVYVANNVYDETSVAFPAIQSYTLNGEFNWQLSNNGIGAFTQFGGIAYNSVDHYLYATELNTNQLHWFSLEGGLLGTWGEWGETPGTFRDPMGIAVDATGLIYVVDSSNGRIQVFQPTAALSVGLFQSPIQLGVTPNPGWQQKISFTLPESGSIDLSVYDTSGRRVATLAKGQRAAGSYTEAWLHASPGVYFVRLQAGSFSQTQRVVRLK